MLLGRLRRCGPGWHPVAQTFAMEMLPEVGCCAEWGVSPHLKAPRAEARPGLRAKTSPTLTRNWAGSSAGRPVQCVRHQRGRFQLLSRIRRADALTRWRTIPRCGPLPALASMGTCPCNPLIPQRTCAVPLAWSYPLRLPSHTCLVLFC